MDELTVRRISDPNRNPSKTALVLTSSPGFTQHFIVQWGEGLRNDVPLQRLPRFTGEMVQAETCPSGPRSRVSEGERQARSMTDVLSPNHDGEPRRKLERHELAAREACL
jgi:hypothetical protein